MRSRVFNLVKARVGALRARYSIVPVIVEKFVFATSKIRWTDRGTSESECRVGEEHTRNGSSTRGVCVVDPTPLWYGRSTRCQRKKHTLTYTHTQNNPSSIMFTSVTSVYYASLLVVLLVSWSSRSQSGCQAFSLSTTSKVSSSSSTQLYASTELKTLPGSTAPFKNGFDPLRLSTVGSESTLAWFQAAYVILVLV